MLRDEILPYVDGNNLVAPNLVASGTKQGSDNGPMFTAELYVMLQKLGQLQGQDVADFQTRIGQCVNAEGMLCRVPIGQDDGMEAPDDYYGTLNGCLHMGNTKIPRQYLMALIKNLGSMDNENPGKWQWAAFMPRQLQLMACVVAAAFPSWKNPLHILARSVCAPLFWYAALVIFTSCINTPASDTDSRRLAWHLIQTVCPFSLACKFASLFWYHRLYSVYGPAGMKGVAKIYYQPGHPFAKYWVSE